jgi:hypothetical protein
MRRDRTTSPSLWPDRALRVIAGLDQQSISVQPRHFGFARRATKSTSSICAWLAPRNDEFWMDARVMPAHDIGSIGA